VIIPFAVVVPSNATPGDHVGGITATLESFVTSKSGQRIRLLQSVGTRVFIRVSGPLHPLLAVKDVAVSYDDPISPFSTGTAVVTYTVSNVGNVALGGKPTVSVSGLFGSKQTVTRLPQIQLLLPGFSVKETAKVTGIYPEVRESAHVSVTRLNLPGSVQPASGPFTAATTFWAVPWLLLAIVILIVASGTWWFLRRRRRGPAPTQGPDDGPGETEADSDGPPQAEEDASVLAQSVAIGNHAGVERASPQPASPTGSDTRNRTKR
jgi:hypothetical protein